MIALETLVRMHRPNQGVSHEKEIHELRDQGPTHLRRRMRASSHLRPQYRVTAVRTSIRNSTGRSITERHFSMGSLEADDALPHGKHDRLTLSKRPQGQGQRT